MDSILIPPALPAIPLLELLPPRSTLIDFIEDIRSGLFAKYEPKSSASFHGHPSIVTFTRVWSRPLILKYPYPKSVPLSEREIIDGISANKCDGSCP